MQRRHAHRPWLALALVILWPVLMFGCSSNPTAIEGTTIQPIPHTDADDIAQTLATTIAADHGGWYYVVKTVCASLATSPGISNTFLLTKPGSGITYELQVGYLSPGVISGTRTAGSTDLAAQVITNGGTFTSANGIDGTYGFRTYTVQTLTDSLFLVANLQSSAGDTLEFTGQFYDSCLALVHSTVAPNASPRLWFMGPDNFVDYVLRIPKDRLTTAPYPIGRNSEIIWLMDCKGLTSVDREDWEFDELIEARMTFDGTEDAALSVGNIQPRPTWEYTYRVNLNTGRITRTN